MSGIILFTPNPTKTLAYASTVATATAALPVTANLGQLRIKNTDTTNIAFINFGDSNVTATIPTGTTPGSMPVGPGETIGITRSADWTHMAVIAGAGTPTVYVTPGRGV